MTKHIADRVKRARPLVDIVQVSFPPTATAVEVGYLIVSNLDTVNDVYRIATSSNPFEKKLSDVVHLAAAKAARSLIDEAFKSTTKDVNNIVVRIISNELAKKHMFEQLSIGLRGRIASATIEELFDNALFKLIEKSENDIWKSHLGGN